MATETEKKIQYTRQGIGWIWLSILVGTVLIGASRVTISEEGRVAYGKDIDGGLQTAGIALVLAGFSGRVTIPGLIGKILPDSKTLEAIGSLLIESRKSEQVNEEPDNSTQQE